MTSAELNKDPGAIARMFDGIAGRYDITNEWLSAGMAKRWRRIVTREIGPRPGMRILDIAAGTGTSSLPLHEAGANVTAADFSAGMVAEGKRRHPELDIVEADATNLPFDDDTFDVTTISFGLRNVIEPTKALEEMLRVTRPGGRIVICEFSAPVNTFIRSAYNLYLRQLLPRIAGVIARNTDSYVYLAESIAQWPNQPELGRWMLAAGWHKVAYRNLTGGIVAMHRGTKPVVTETGDQTGL